MRAWQQTMSALALRAGVVALLFLGGCGGVDGGGTGAVSQGAVEGLGSVVVNGVRYDDSTAVITDDDGVKLARNRVQLGTMTRIESTPTVQVGTVLRATASSIRITSDLIGNVTEINPTAGTVKVLGQTVQVTPATVFDPSFTNGIQSLGGATVEVFGRLDPANARYTATRIEPRANATFFKVRGLIGTIDRTQRTFRIGGIDIGYAGLPAADVANIASGKLVRVKVETHQGSSNVWPALSVQSAVVVLPDLDFVEIEGRITAWVSTRSFSVDGIVVDATRARFEVDDDVRIVLGTRVSVKGRSENGVLIASKVEAEEDENSSNSTFELHGTITALNTGNKTFVVQNMTVDYNGTVNFSGAPASSLRVGASVEVHGRLSATGTAIQATEVNIAP